MKEQNTLGYMRVGTKEQLKENDYIESVAAYIRVSTQEQKLHGLSLDAQREKLSEYAEKHKLRIVEWYVDEGVSGRKLIKKRPELQRMVKDAQKGNFSRIIFIKLDRFFRSVAEYHECMKLIDPVVWTATEEKYDLSTANGRAFVNMKITIAELEADQTSERIRLVNEYKIKSGSPLFGSQCFPFCYSVKEPDPGERNKSIQKSPEYKDVMTDLIDFVETNKSVRGGMSFVNNKYSLQFSYGQIYNALKNEMICGSYKGNPNYCDPYISRERFEALQKIIAMNPRTTTKRIYVFAGLLRCPGCGRSMSGFVSRNRRKNSDGSKTSNYYYYYYRCQHHNVNKICPFPSTISQNSIEKQLLAKLTDYLAKAKNADFQLLEESRRVSKYNLEDLQAELDRLNYSWQKGRIKDAAEYDRKYDELMEQIAEATNEIIHLTDSPDYDRIEAALVSGWQDIYRDLDDEHKRAFWRGFIEEIHFDWTGRNKTIKDIKFF